MNSVIHYDPWTTLGHVNHLLDNVFHKKHLKENESFFAHWQPAVDIKEEQHRFLVIADLPGVSPEHIEISWENNLLTVKGKREEETQEEKNNYTRVERSMGAFQRSFSLPNTANSEGISAQTRHGVLEISIPKKQQAQPRKISVQVS